MPANLQTSDQPIVRVCTYNVRSEESDNGTLHAWENRQAMIKKCLENMQPTIIGTQEAYPPQLNDILDDLNKPAERWSWVGGEIDHWQTVNAIFYRHDLFSLISTNTFWFNGHPSIIGAAWGAEHPRGCTRAHLEHKVTRHPYIIYNLHLDFLSENARQYSIRALLSQIKIYDDPIDQVIVTGDFNNWSKQNDIDAVIDKLFLSEKKLSEIQQMKQAGFVDTYQHGETPTYNGFGSAGYGPKIDFVWISCNSIHRVQGETKVDDYHDQDGSFPSDHFPVYADLISTVKVF